MKKMMYIALIITAIMLLMPLAVLGKGEEKIEIAVETAAPISKPTTKKDIFRVYDTQNKTINEMSAEEYIFGVVAAEMPALYETEALKAQAVASYTYACYKRNINSKKDYDITTDFSTDQSFKTEEKARADWGEKADEYTKKLKSIINSVKGETICYKNEPILAVYHAVSSGTTYSAKDVWGKEIEYLQSVSSEGDRLADNYTVVLEFSESDLKEKLLPLVSKQKENMALLSNIVTKDNGLVESIKIAGEKVDGSKIRSALNLPSTNFSFEKTRGNYIFTCLGHGHGVGMSQKGADYMAKQGYNYKEILSHYYINTSVKK